MLPARSEIRQSTVRSLLEKVRKRNYEKFLISLRLEKLRMFSGVSIAFDFPVVALVGPNGGGKTTILGACGCVFSKSVQKKSFQRSRFGDDGVLNWIVEYDIIDRAKNKSGSIRGTLCYDGETWKNNEDIGREVVFLGLTRTLPLSENPNFHLRGSLTRKETVHADIKIHDRKIEGDIADTIRKEGERVLGKSLEHYMFYNIVATITKYRKLKETNDNTSQSLGENVTQHKLYAHGNKERVRSRGRRGGTRDRYHKIGSEDKITVIDGRNYREKTYSIAQTMFVGGNGKEKFSELNFGAGESSVLRIISEIESLNDGALVLIDEIENGLHPIAVIRFVEYLIDVSARKKIQVVFTTHSDYAINPLPGEAIWACLDGRLQQGRLSIEALRAVSGRIDKRLAVFVEDEFAIHWIEAVLRERLSENFDEIGVYFGGKSKKAGGDAGAVKTHLAHSLNPAISFKSLCFIDGDSEQSEDSSKWVFRLPGGAPEATVFDETLKNLENNVAFLTLACQRPLGRQADIEKAVRSVSHTNRDSHLLFAQVGEKLGFLPEAIVRGAFLAVWIQEHPVEVDAIVSPILAALKKQDDI
jgi:predicted ATPase